MRNYILIAVTLFACSTISAEEAERVESLSSKVIMKDSTGYFVLSDKSCWKAIGFSRRWRSLSEWWNNVQLAPETHECVPNDWYLGTEIEVYPKRDNMQVKEADAANQDAIKQCTHMFVNSRTGQVLFAIALEPSVCIIQLHKEAYQDGHAVGFNEGRMKSTENAREIRNAAYTEGHTIGYREGFRAAIEGEQPGASGLNNRR
ncbi:MAG: hypothetical protein HYX48_06760 [Chlamydiales bacterium]|nr:hypothetical protein [Chlamydiales bacterium]